MRHLTAIPLALVAVTSTIEAQTPTRADSARADSVRRLSGVTVTATRSSTDILASPLAITRLDRSAYPTRSGYALTDALTLVPGVLAQGRSGTSDVRIVIRGFGARGAGDRSNAGTTRGVRFLLDGIPETEPDGRTALDNVDLELVQSIDVIRSNSSSLWGNAAGGVVSLSTVPTSDAPFAAATVQSGSFGLQRYIASAGDMWGRAKVYGNFVNTGFDGWRQNSDARRVLLNFGVVVPTGDQTTVRAHVTGANNLFHIPGPLSQAQVDADPTLANPTYNTRDERRWNRLARIGVSVDHRFNEHSSISTMAFANPKMLQRSERGTYRDFTRIHFGGNAVFTDRRSVGSVGNRLTIGADQAYQDGAILFYSLSPTAGRGTTLQQNKREGANNSGLFVENEITIRDRVLLSVGARYDEIGYYNQDFITPRLDSRKFFQQVTPKLGVTFRRTPTHTFYANVGGGVEAPAGNETDPVSTFGQDTISNINPLLDPIRSYTSEVGTKQQVVRTDGWLRAVGYDVALYHTTVRNEIVPYRGGRFYFTAGRAIRSGAEFGVNALTSGGVRVQSALTLSRNRYAEYVVDSVHYNRALAGRTANYSGNQIVGVPSWFQSTQLTWTPPRASRISLVYGVQSSGRYFADDANRVSVPAFTIMNTGLTLNDVVRAGGTRLRGFIGVENLADRRYIGSSFLNPDVVNNVPLAFEPGLPRSVTVSLTVTRTK
jgi:iron complex outermembrane recepter protein